MESAATGENGKGIIAIGENCEESWLLGKFVRVEKTVVASRSLFKNKPSGSHRIVMVKVRG